MEFYPVSLLGLLTLAAILNTGSCDGSTSVLCVESEKQALLRFKQQLKDPSDRLSSWSASKLECCNWIGVVCDKLTGHVKELHLDNPYADWETQTERNEFERSKLQGNVNASLLDLKYLSYLDLSFNDFGGIPIPSFIGSLVCLTYLNLSKAGFEGVVPHQLGKLSNLRQLGVQGPATFLNDRAKLYVENLYWLSNLSSLVYLDISGVNLSAASDWLLMINKLPSLLELRLSDCGLVLIPSLSIVNFTSLQILEISSNNFGSPMPKWILSLSNLISLNLYYSGFEGPIPNGFSNLTSLRILDLSSNDLISPLPDWLFNLDGLISLNLARNNFEDTIPSGLKNLTTLRNLDFGEIDFAGGTIPEWLYSFQDLEYLDLHTTNIQGKISNSIQNMTSLVMLDLSYNELEGAFPRTIGNLCNLQVISLEGNKLGGDITEAIRNLYGCLSNNLRSLILSGNNFTGHLNAGFMEFKNLLALDLSGNQISGSIPESLGRLPFLEYMRLAANQLIGTLPQSIGLLSNLQTFDISYNKLEGVVTEVHFLNLKNLREFRASHNRIDLKVSPAWVPPFRLNSVELRYWNLGPQFPMWLQSQDFFWNMDLSCTGISDTVPTWFWNITSHTGYLNLSHNQIHGQLPSYLGIEYQYVMIYLGSNKFNGSVPRISRNVAELDLSNNSLSGDISNLLCHPKVVQNRLEILHLGENHLTGEIPNCWMSWQSLKVIKLGNNNLTGKLPSSIGYLNGLQSLHLRNNDLFGTIPETLVNCNQLLTLDLGLNNFVGNIPAWLGSLSNLIVLGLRSNKFNGEIPPEFCHLTSLQIVDLADNNLSGSIPRCLSNLTSMIELPSGSSSSDHQLFYSFYYGTFFEEALVVIKGRELPYDTILTLLTNLDFSSNKLSGKIPEEITALVGLRGLNLAGNYLTGEIPKNIGNMKTLESVDLSKNLISGDIPPSLSHLSFLNYLNLSYNNLSGQIPLSTQLQSLDASSFIGNRLCGPPLTENCNSEIRRPDNKNEGENAKTASEMEGFYVSMGVGFVVGLWGILVPLLYSRRWRYSYYGFLNRMWTSLHVKFAIAFRGSI